jgi:diguanylate cyclase (GGDEF)-like protein
MHVLVADDEPGTRLMLATMVERLGHRCTQAADGEEAWRLFGATRPDVVITDWDMPGVDGTELIRRIRGDREAEYAFLIVVTGQADDASARVAMEAGADDLAAKPLDPVELDRMLIVAGRVTALHRRLHRAARHDALTGVGNRLRLAEDVEALCGRAARYGHAYCVALFDVDRFKAFNDAEGHLAGDEILRAVAGALAATMRSGDTIYRYGGEEFLVLLPEQTLETAELAAERLRAAVEALALPHPTGGVVTVSGGVAGVGDASSTPEQLFELADQGLYRAKEAGRNRVVVERVGGPGIDERPIRILIADDDPVARMLLGALAGREPGLELVGEAQDAVQAVELTARRRPDVVVLDFDMPGGGGVRAAVDIREASPGVRIVAYSGDDSQAAQLDMSRAGAVGYIVKGSPDEEIVRVIRSSARW